MARQVVVGVAGCAVVLAVTFATLSMRYAAGKLESLGSTTGHATAETAMQELMVRSQQARRVEIVAAGNDGPGLRYVVARVWAPTAARMREANPREVGSYFLRMEHGWVHLPEDDVNAQVLAIGKMLLDHLPGTDRRQPKGRTHAP